MKEAFQEIFGLPWGAVIFQLLEGTQFTIYLFAIAFVGGGLIGALVAFARISPRPCAHGRLSRSDHQRHLTGLYHRLP